MDCQRGMSLLAGVKHRFYASSGPNVFSSVIRHSYMTYIGV